MPLSNLNLTKFTIKIPHSARDKTVRKAFEGADVKKKWLETPLAKRIALRELRAKQTDFDRFKIKCLKQQVLQNSITVPSLDGPTLLQKTRIVRAKLKQLKKTPKA